MHIQSSPSTTDRLLQPIALGALKLPNRVIMSPMTRMRVDADLAPLDYVADYYAQRASAGLIITESIATADYGEGFAPLPGLFTPIQAEKWRRVVDRVHKAGGLIAAQLWNAGRAQGPEAANGRPPGWAVADPIAPKQLHDSEIAAMITRFQEAARIARDIGFDAVEVHSGSANLLDRFLRSATNQRRDGYGGDLKGRTRLLLEILDAVGAVIGNDRVGLKLSPSATVAGAPDPEGHEIFSFLLDRLRPLDLAWVHATRTTPEDREQGSGPGISLEWIREHFSGTLLGAGAFDRAAGERVLADGVLDAVVYGRLFLANPDLPERFARRAALNTPDRSTFYTPGAAGLIDYPSLP
ncbi:hypothetical protein ACZ91_41395 [Streptomyces regensis]|nr:hypothetical protein ACZ91_41395 [Streptomyces regensis]